MTQVTSLYGPATDDIARVDDRLIRLAAGHHPLLAEALTYVFDNGGKRLRPALVMLCGRFGKYNPDDLVTLAAAVEAVHIATLVHDDTIDEALTRRGLDTVNQMWDRSVAVLLGDFLFGQSACLMTELDNIRLMKLLSAAVMEMVSGELRQYSSSRDRVLDESDYFNRITGKTASLFKICCEGAALVSQQPERHIKALRSYGTNLGIAFQIADDVLDFTGDDASLGKPAGNDLRHGTITLPVILMAESLPSNSPIRRSLEDGTDLDSVVEAVRHSGALEASLSRAAEYGRAAASDIAFLPSGDAKDVLIRLTESAINRVR